MIGYYSALPPRYPGTPDPGCTNCDGRGCMGCVLREWDHQCANNCPACCISVIVSHHPRWYGKALIRVARLLNDAAYIGARRVEETVPGWGRPQ